MGDTWIQPTSSPCAGDEAISPGEQRELFLSEASRVLAESLDYEETLRTVARLAVPEIADWCIIDLLQEDGTLQRVATEHRDPQRAVLTAALHRNPPPRDAATGLPNVIRTRTTEYVPHVSEALLQEREHDPERLRILRELGLSSTICVPLVARNRLVGAITLSTDQGRALTPEHVRMTEDLARRAATAIDNARLYHDAQRALRAREEILAIVTHDLRTPLSAIMAGAALLRSADPALLDAERVRQRADAIQRSAQHMSRLVKDLADLAQIDAGHLSIARTRQDPASLVREVVVDLQPTAAQRDGVLRCAALTELPMVSIDRDRVRQIFTNLIGNASKAGASTIEVGARSGETDVMFWVSDDGPGISPEELPRMFERYWRSRTAGYQGTGLGLPIASGIVKAHGGRMWVESTLGAGSTFFFSIPRDEPR